MARRKFKPTELDVIRRREQARKNRAHANDLPAIRDKLLAQAAKLEAEADAIEAGL